MSKYTRNLERYTRKEYNSHKELAADIEYLKDIRSVLSEAIEQYSNFEKLNDWRQPGYANATESYERKAQQIDIILLNLEAKSVSLPPEPSSIPV